MKHREYFGFGKTHGVSFGRGVFLRALLAVCALISCFSLCAAADGDSSEAFVLPETKTFRVGKPTEADFSGMFLLYPGDEPGTITLASDVSGYFDLHVSSDDFCTLVSLTFLDTYTVAGTGNVYFLNVTGSAAPEHLHTYLFAPTSHRVCTDTITLSGACTCGKATTLTLPSLHHVVTCFTSPTCTEPGKYAYSCSLCDYSGETSIAPAGHDFRYPQDGISDVSHIAECAICGTKNEEAHSFTAGDIVQSVSCEAPEINRYWCACGYFEDRETLPPMGHQWDSGAIFTAPASDSDGIFRYTCTECGATRDLVLHAANGHHHWKILLTRRASCEERGLVTATCDCGETVTFCGAPAVGHCFSDWEGDTGSRFHTCLICGLRETEKETSASATEADLPDTTAASGTNEPSSATNVPEPGNTDTNRRGHTFLRVFLRVLLVLGIVALAALLILFLLVIFAIRLRKRKDSNHNKK